MTENYAAVLIVTPNSERNRLYCNPAFRPVLWPELNDGEPQRVSDMLNANGLRTAVVKVTLETADPK